MRKRFIDPYLLLNQSEDDGGGGKPATSGSDDQARNDLGFPSDTPVKEMTPDQQAAYWKYQARKHESRAKAFGDMTPEQVQKLIDEREDARKKGLSDVDRAVEEARDTARKEAIEAAAKREAETALKMALRGRVIDGSAAFSRPDFVKDGAADVEAILEWVDQNSQVATGVPAGGAGNSALRHGAGERENLRVSGRKTGRAEAEKRFGKKS